jgi:hypothetical protein
VHHAAISIIISRRQFYNPAAWLFYAFDGTSREDDVDDAKDTNVVRFARAYRGRRVYRAGVGTRFGAIDRVVGGWMGIGLHDRVREALVASR